MPTIIRAPQLGESISEAIVARWFKQVGDPIVAGEAVLELETDKITVEVPAPVAGVLRTRLAESGATVAVGDPIAEIEEGAVAAGTADPEVSVHAEIPAAPTARAEARRRGLALDEVEGSGRKGRVVKEDVVAAAELRAGAPDGLTAGATAVAGVNRSAPPPVSTPRPSPPLPALDPATRETRVPMTTFRRRIAERLVAAQATAAILTTFNEVDMSAVRELRERHKQAFVDKHGVKLGFMSFFVRATVDALREFPAINAEIRGDEVVYKNFYDIGVAVGGGKGLVVPVLRDCDRLGFAAIEREIARLAGLARESRLQITDLEGGTFTISNGGIYGSMLSTPILNHPQSGILGLHNIVDRPVAIAGRVEIRPIMYLALSYDHRLVDGREAVQFLTHVKSSIEDPSRVMLEI